MLGEDHHKIQRWIASGWLRENLQGTRRHDGNGKDIHRFREKDILNFLRNYPQEFNLGKVDLTLFLDLVLLKGREMREEKVRREIETRRGRRGGVAARVRIVLDPLHSTRTRACSPRRLTFSRTDRPGTNLRDFHCQRIARALAAYMRGGPAGREIKPVTTS